MKYAVTAATGKFGQSAVSTLNAKVGPENVLVIARNQDKATQLFPDNLIRIGNYDDVDAMTKAFEDVERVLFISSQPGGAVDRATAHKNVVTALSAAHVKFVAYTSFPHAQTAVSALASDHRTTENAITATNIAHSFLRNNWYLENEMGFLQSGAHNQEALYWANNTAGWALEREYAAAAATVLMAEDPQEVYEFAGAPRTYAELGQALQKATGNQFKITQVSQEAYTQSLETTGLDHDTAALFASFQAPINEGALAETSADLANVLGHQPLEASAAIKEILAR
ncbi:NAD(P)H-binding protein [Lactiplantibacillus pentosus]|uniref:NAD(P)H-binding protein n=1 Tax=Lactiplantibacillus pentosus TaxID=1589 RepID=UPI001C1EFCF7|nr:NAD(P)H-binding protein [Lactiplantibacillus pentosus]MBU7464994.1 NAD(P)H-binding protein [Lactiplantibacillus pentosus]MBU7491031.1 NAD(P)H-binding protein [Lactiplantibacillus pentosus]MBU7494070.1 NAD(P)H-binding protein [Lactiplantibacillus pentosus]MBU7520067.1 NAD(P)H-binding protein [Lactiplantibacillus pentosus]MBU7526696.1 NAD(P)H-binding protein [Lactiplantibacillus pentosus]